MNDDERDEVLRKMFENHDAILREEKIVARLWWLIAILAGTLATIAAVRGW